LAQELPAHLPPVPACCYKGDDLKMVLVMQGPFHPSPMGLLRSPNPPQAAQQPPGSPAAWFPGRMGVAAYPPAATTGWGPSKAYPGRQGPHPPAPLQLRPAARNRRPPSFPAPGHMPLSAIPPPPTARDKPQPPTLAASRCQDLPGTLLRAVGSPQVASPAPHQTTTAIPLSWVSCLALLLNQGVLSPIPDPVLQAREEHVSWLFRCLKLDYLASSSQKFLPICRNSPLEISLMDSSGCTAVSPSGHKVLYQKTLESNAIRQQALVRS